MLTQLWKTFFCGYGWISLSFSLPQAHLMLFPSNQPLSVHMNHNPQRGGHMFLVIASDRLVQPCSNFYLSLKWSPQGHLFWSSIHILASSILGPRHGLRLWTTIKWFCHGRFPSLHLGQDLWVQTQDHDFRGHFSMQCQFRSFYFPLPGSQKLPHHFWNAPGTLLPSVLPDAMT